MYSEEHEVTSIQAGDVAQLVKSACLACRRTWDQEAPSVVKRTALSVVAGAYYTKLGEVEARGSEGQVHLQLHSVFRAILGHLRLLTYRNHPCLTALREVLLTWQGCVQECHVRTPLWRRM